MKAKDLRTKDVEDLRKQLTSNREELMNLRFQRATGALENSARLYQVKHDIARILTVLNEKSLVPAAAGAAVATETAAAAAE